MLLFLCIMGLDGGLRNWHDHLLRGQDQFDDRLLESMWILVEAQGLFGLYVSLSGDF